MNAPPENPPPPRSVRTSFRRALAFAGVSVVAVFSVHLAWQLAFETLVTDAPGRLLRHVKAVESWQDWISRSRRILAFVAPSSQLAAGAMMAGVSCALLSCAVFLAVSFRRWRPTAVAAGVFCLLVAVALLFPSVSVGTYFVMLAMVPVIYGLLLERPIQGIGLDGMGILEGCRKTWRHFRKKNLLWLVLSGWILYYLGFMGCFVSLEWCLGTVWRAAGWEGSVMGDFGGDMLYGHAPTWAGRIEPSLMIAGMAFYHFLCASYLLNQLAYLVEAGKSPVDHGRFWWPFKRRAGAAAGAVLLAAQDCARPLSKGVTMPEVEARTRRPNVVFVFGDQWRAQATGYAGDPNVKTPNLDRLADESVNLTHAVAGCPVSSPYRASLITGQYPLTHGVFVNDVYLRPEATSIAEAFASAGYDTAYIGKWHLDAHGRSSYIPPERRQGFEYWKVLECTHDYNHSAYYAGDSDSKLFWEGYDAIAQTRDACSYVREHAGGKPFLLVLSWGPPHNPYGTAPEEHRALYSPGAITLRSNVPKELAGRARRDLAGYYAHCSALDACVGDLLTALDEDGIADDTIFVFTSDHGDMLGSQGMQRKQKPWDESIRVPFLLRYPRLLGRDAREAACLIDAPDIMPTLLGLAGLPIPETVEGLDFSTRLRGGGDPSGGAALIACHYPFGEWLRGSGGREYRGLRTRRHTYVRTLDGPWLLYDNERDPHQLENLVARPEHADLREELDARLQRRLEALGDEFLPGMEYIRRWGYKVEKGGTVPYTM